MFHLFHVGHGLSSHYPAGLMYHFWDHISHVRLVAAHFGWTKFSILGHSMGGIVGSIFTSVTPEMVDRLVMIDIVKPISIPAKFQPDKSVKAIESYLQVLKKLEQGPPSYPYEAARQRLLQANNGSVDVEAADVLMRRGTKRNEDGGYYFARDLRHVNIYTIVYPPTISLIDFLLIAGDSVSGFIHGRAARRVRQACPLPGTHHQGQKRLYLRGQSRYRGFHQYLS